MTKTRKASKTRKAPMSLRERGRQVIRQADTDDGFGYLPMLKREARARARALGHNLGLFAERAYTNMAFNAVCQDCWQLAVVHADPPGADPIYGPVFDGACVPDRRWA